MSNWLNAIAWNEDGLVPAIAREAKSGQVLMLAWMNRQALELSLNEGRAIYWSRSRKKLWRKGEESGHVQRLIEVRLDCDNDCLLLSVEQEGLACHTGRAHCFYQRLEVEGGQRVWCNVDPVLKAPEAIYGQPRHE